MCLIVLRHRASRHTSTKEVARSFGSNKGIVLYHKKGRYLEENEPNCSRLGRGHEPLSCHTKGPASPDTDNSIHITMNSGSTTSTSVNYATRPVRQNLVRSADIRATNTSVAMHAAHGAVAPAVAAPGGAGHATSGAAARSPAQRTKWKPLAQSPPVSRRALIEKKPPAEEEEKLCAICTEPLGAGPFGRLDCSHGAQFHAQCLDKWLRKNPNCPLCRAASPVRSRHRNSSPAERNTPPPRSGGGGGGRSSIMGADKDVTPPVSPPLFPPPAASLSLFFPLSRLVSVSGED